MYFRALVTFALIALPSVLVAQDDDHPFSLSTDSVGNLFTVQEPHPSFGTVSTNLYDILDHLVTVSMPRGSTTSPGGLSDHRQFVNHCTAQKIRSSEGSGSMPEMNLAISSAASTISVK